MTFDTKNLGAPSVSQPDGGDPSAGSSGSEIDRSVPQSSAVPMPKDIRALRARKEELESIHPKDKKSLGQWLSEYLLIDLSMFLLDGL